MARKRNIQPKEPEITQLIVSREEFETKLQERIEIGEGILNFKVNTQGDFQKNKDEYYDWSDYNSEYLKQSFNTPENEYKSSYNNAGIWNGIMVIGGREPSPNEKLKEFKEEVEAKVKNLKKLKAKTELLKCQVEEKSKEPASKKIASVKNLTEIFIVHGHDERIKTEVARTIEKLGLKPIILHEQANEGKTIIEKFEVHSNVGFAVVLMTCDDLGKAKKSDDEKYRARQNVILEMGYFIGKLGRNRVLPLYESGVELPSDLYGLLYVPIDKVGSWKFTLVKELKAVGYDVDANKIL